MVDDLRLARSRSVDSGWWIERSTPNRQKLISMILTNYVPDIPPVQAIEK